MSDALACEWGWITLTELVTDGIATWFETQRYLYFSPAEARELFAERLTERGWEIAP